MRWTTEHPSIDYTVAASRFARENRSQNTLDQSDKEGAFGNPEGVFARRNDDVSVREPYLLDFSERPFRPRLRLRLLLCGPACEMGLDRMTWRSGWQTSSTIARALVVEYTVS